jgi:hypothetical protein
VQFFQTDLSAILRSPAWQLTVLAVVATAALEMLAAVWAGASRWHWFPRALVVWGAIAALVPIRAYEPALLFAISSPLTVAEICCWRATAARLTSSSNAQAENRPASRVRFGLLDLFLLLTIVGLSLVVVIEVVRHLQMIAWGGLAGYAAAFVVLGVASYGVIFGQQRRFWAYAAAAGAIAAATVLVWSSSDWLRLGGQFGIYPILPFFEETHWVAVALTIQIGAIYCVLLLLFRLALASEPSLRRWITRSVLVVAAIVFLGLWLAIYVPMLRLTAVPPAVTAQPNHYHRIMAIATEVAASKRDEESLADLRSANPDSAVPDRLKSVYDELLPLLDAPNAIVLPPLPTAKQEGVAGWSRTMDSIQQVRALGRSLNAEAKNATANSDLGQAVAWNLANVRLGTLFSRGGTTIDYLIGMAVEGLSTTQLAELRQRLNPDQSRTVIAALERALAERESPQTVRQRDTAYWERWDGWRGRLETVLANIQGQWPGTDASSADMRRRALHRLLQVDLSLRLFHHDNRRWPDSLDELVPGYLPTMPVDPYGGQPLHYRSTDEGFVLYRVGQDLSDDGGRFGNLLEYNNAAGFDLDLDISARP